VSVRAPLAVQNMTEMQAMLAADCTNQTSLLRAPHFITPFFKTPQPAMEKENANLNQTPPANSIVHEQAV